LPPGSISSAPARCFSSAPKLTRNSLIGKA
jgi:hypothetical protein